MEEKEEIKQEMQKAWEDLQTFRRVELRPMQERESKMMDKVNDLRHQIETIERRNERVKEAEVIQKISKDGFKTVKQLVLEGKGNVDDFNYFTHTGKIVRIGIRYEKAPRHYVATKDYNELKRIFEKGLKICTWFGSENTIKVTYVKTGKSFDRMMDVIYANPKEKVEPEQTQ